MATISNTPRPGYVWDSADNVWYPIGVGAHQHTNAADTPAVIPNALVDAKGDLLTATADNTPARLAVGNNGETLVADSSTSTGLRYQPNQAAGRNIVINGGFDVWQRNTSIAGGSNTTFFTADRWNAYRGVTGSTFSRQVTADTSNLPNIQYCVRVQRDSGNTNAGGILLNTTIETINSIPFAGQTVTMSFWARRGANYSGSGNVLEAQLRSGTGTDQNDISGFTDAAGVVTTYPALTTTWVRYTATGTVASNVTELAIRFNFTPTGTAGANDYFEVTGVQLELGSVATAFTRTGGTIQGELAACQRYYYRDTAVLAYSRFGNGSAASTTSAQIDVRFPVQLRAIFSAIDSSSLLLDDGGGGAFAVTAVTGVASGSGVNYGSVACAATGLTQFRFYHLEANNNVNAYLGFSAEL
jgi:hypothetical protein